jgi:hypothetical protein
MSWVDWYSDERPWLFSQEQTRANARLLADALSTQFIESPDGRARSRHPLLSMWDNPGPSSLLLLNALAEDTRLLQGKRNVEVVFRDLRDSDACLPGWHALRAAALLERASAGTVVEFVRSQNETAPDFIVEIGGTQIPVEAKLLTMSAIEEDFHRQADVLIRAVIESLQGRKESFGITIVFKSKPEPVLTAQVISTFEGLLRQWSAKPATLRADQFNVRIEVPGLSSGIAEHRLVHVLMPVPIAEVLRVKDRAGRASAQLRSHPNAARSGLLALGLTDRQDGSLVYEILERAMRGGRHRGIAATLLMKQALHVRPPVNTIVDLAEIRFNSRAEVPLSANIHLRSVGVIAQLTKAEPPSLDVPAYRHLLASGRRAGTASAALGLNDVPRVPKELLM